MWQLIPLSAAAKPLAEAWRAAELPVAMALDDKPRRERIAGDFASVVNMTTDELRKWLRTKASRSVGWKGPDGALRESVGHASGRRIVTLLGKRSDELSSDDYAHMRKVVGFVRRHLAQPPANRATSRWRYSL